MAKVIEFVNFKNFASVFFASSQDFSAISKEQILNILRLGARRYSDSLLKNQLPKKVQNFFYSTKKAGPLSRIRLLTGNILPKVAVLTGACFC